MNKQTEPVLILYNRPRKTPGAKFAWEVSEAGVLEEVRAVGDALAGAGITVRSCGVDQLGDLPAILQSSPEKVIFNLVEDFRGHTASACYVPAVCRAHGKICTGSDTPCLMLTLDKWRSKVLLQSLGMPVPAAAVVAPGQDMASVRLPEGTVIVKPVSADASEGITAKSVVKSDPKLVEPLVRAIHEQFRQPALIEQFVGDRELNVSLLQRGGDVRALPIAEIDFTTFGADRPRIVDYAAKWVPQSFEYKNTPRVIPAALPDEVADKVRRAAVAAWHAVGCSDYARVDFRLVGGEPVILEVNSNPDISIGGGFAAALGAAKIEYRDFVLDLVRNASDRHEQLVAALEAAATPPVQTKAKIIIRRTEQRDREPILTLLTATNFFRPNEIEIAREVLDEALAKGAGGAYQSYCAEDNGEAVGWVCFGQTPCTLGTFDLYWLCVSPRTQRGRLGTALMSHAETLIRESGGRLVIVETSGRATYDNTRRFYEKISYREAARIKDFYAPGDDKVVYSKEL